MPRLRTLLATGIALALALTLGVGTASADIFNLDFDHATGEVGHVNPPFGTVTVTSPNSGEVDIVYQANTSQIIGFHEIGSAMGGVVYLLETKINQLRLFAVIHNNSANYGIIPVMIQTDF
jgi:hypothetical protein